MRIGMFLTGRIAIAILLYEGGRKVLVNGQHQCKALLRYGLPVSAVCEEWSCENPFDLSNLYSRFDNPLVRTVPEILRPEADALGIDWKPRIVTLVVGAATLGPDRKKQGIKILPTKRKALLKDNAACGSFVSHIIGNRNNASRHMTRASVARAMMDTWSVDKVTAREFWTIVRDGEMLKKGDPVWRLRDYLTTTKHISSQHREMYVKCIHAWNSFITNEPTNIRYVEDAPLPKIKKKKKGEIPNRKTSDMMILCLSAAA